VSAPRGQPAPDFTLPGTGGRDYALSDYRGRPVVLVFYPGDDTPVCTRQLTTYNEDLASFDALDVQVLAISPQDVASHERFASRHGFRFPLLADTAKEVAALYDTLGPMGFPRRSIVVIDAGGVVRWAHRSLAGLSFRPVDEILAAVRDADRPIGSDGELNES
jgi:thioredoxin-dependent peroxiredoxin